MEIYSEIKGTTKWNFLKEIILCQIQFLIFFIFLTSVRNEIGNQCQGSMDNCFIHIRDPSQSANKMAVFLLLTKVKI